MNKKEYQDCLARLINHHEEWNKVKLDGAFMHHDGSQLNVYQRHIRACRTKIHEYCTANGLELPTEYFFPEPQEYPPKYMIDERSLRERAAKTKAMIESSDEYKELVDLRDHLKVSDFKTKINTIIYSFESLKGENLLDFRNELKRFSERFEQLPSLVTEIKNKLIEEAEIDYEGQINFLVQPFVEDYEDDMEM